MTRTRTHSKSLSPSRTIPRPSWTQNAVRQLKLIVPGAVVTQYLGSVDRFLAVLEVRDGSWQRKIALITLCNGITMVLLFLFVLGMIYLKGEHPDWRTWRQSGSLSKIIPILTANIIIGWFLLILVLGKYSGMGYIEGTIGAAALYALAFGLLALIPAPRDRKRNY